MRLRDILFPWGRLLELERDLGEARGYAERFQRKLTALSATLVRTLAELQTARGALAAAEAKLREQHLLLRGAHFRDPATGRLGPKGRIYLN